MRRKVKIAVLFVCKVFRLFALSRVMTRRGVRIICYHGLSSQNEFAFKPKLFMRLATFQRRLALVKAMGFPILRLEEAVAALSRGDHPDGATVITIDDGWHSTYGQALSVLNQLDIPATIFMSTYYMENRIPDTHTLLEYALWSTTATVLELATWPPSIRGPWDLANPANRRRALLELVGYVDSFPAERRPALAQQVVNALGLDWNKIDQSKMFYLMDAEEVRAVSAAGLDVQLHTHRHRLPFDDRETTEREIEDNRRALSPLVNGRLAHLAYPKGDYHPRQFDWLSAAAIVTACTCRPGLNYPDTHRLELRRFLDGEDVSDLEFEAELTGMTEIISRIARRGRDRAA